MTEADLIASSQKDVAYLKRLLARLDKKAADLVTINHQEGRFEASAEAMEWQSDVAQLRADLLDAHSKSSKSLLKNYGPDVLKRGPFR